MTAMGALSLKVDERTQERLRHLNSQPDNEGLHRRQSLSVAFQDIDGNIRGLHICNLDDSLSQLYIWQV